MSPDSGLSLALFTALFLATCALLLAAPFQPAWQEWHHPTDRARLGVPPDQTSEVRFLALRFRDRMTLMLRSARPPVGDAFDPPDHHGSTTLPLPHDLPVVTHGAVSRDDRVACVQPLYADGDLLLHGGAHLAEVMAQGRLTLGPGSVVAGWAHAAGELALGADSVAVRRISSEQRIDLAAGCCFERVNAPTIRFGTDPGAAPQPDQAPQPDPLPEPALTVLPGARAWGGEGWRIDGDCSVPPHSRVVGSLVVTGALDIGAGAVIVGDVKARKDLRIGAGVRLSGAAVCEHAVDVGADAHIAGPLVAERCLTLARGVQLGRADALTTVSAEDIVAACGVVAHGTVWAHRSGLVWAGT